MAVTPFRTGMVDRGAHVAAREEPDLLVGDVRAFFRQLREKG